jgi:2-hydroxy-3-keto-5-methylthiopentenyl-1-phosphate phosphatase
LIDPILEREGVQLEVRANEVEWHPDGWRASFPTGDTCQTCGEPCKRAAMPEANGSAAYVGDGYSDRCAAQLAERIFARAGLARYLDANGVAYEPFEDLHEVVAALDG